MVVRRRKKVTKYRAHTTHGGGSRKKRRGAGSRGGRGNAGTGKRAGHKKAGQHRIFGKDGFRPRRTVSPLKAVNVSYFTPQRCESLVKSGKITKESDVYVIDLVKLGFGRLLGAGDLTVKLTVQSGHLTGKAVEKIQAAGGSVPESA
ncbi:50S ribosomal protein L15 [Candidatus Woesearchaeota archaeon CG10_big_fil_rev_8_21_14_0_10_45_16]|nr:MAG: 50S ribosomal protein L15 [Candidatus Woesearchaeota archaeon CG10_big_fil_rev_8_21_14_0_10_45_16]